MLAEVQRALRIREEHGGLVGTGRYLMSWEGLNADIKSGPRRPLCFLDSAVALVFKDGRVLVNDINLIILAVLGRDCIEGNCPHGL